MNGSRKSNAPSEEYSYLLKAADVVEIVKCRPQAEAVELVADVLRSLVKAQPASGAHRKYTSGFTQRQAPHHALSACPTCGDVKRLWRHGAGLDCADCIMTAMLEEKFRHS
jgi:hypothetical protein